MGIFGKIKDAIFGHKDPGPGHRPTIPAGMAGGPPAQPQPSGGQAIGQADTQVQPAPAPASKEVDVEQVLADISTQRGNPDLNYKTSIVDLMKLLGIDSSLENRKELAQELGYTGELNGSAEMNIWLHKATMKQLAANGGRVPASFID
ncbi:hypothetical protein GGQ97_002784 [Sphingomonas kaistensis]|uniref:DUF3597 domain-containing protein n=1 Tax=Sphingomonas kaistensis TaxID=298708 RepID=A0A7X5Y8K3_9SPHN|nr:DUF3597 domain-containing protein [Sphingomonas kaistensis]NJC06991.1 hypothetical protein [Sphingomonas kaistensis]